MHSLCVPGYGLDSMMGEGLGCRLIVGGLGAGCILMDRRLGELVDSGDGGVGVALAILEALVVGSHGQIGFDGCSLVRKRIVVVDAQ